ncbi:hypothetical protein RJ640_016626 [Escallonia rubra]|uniref:CCHC-type domain-containing protein n=1 Tax=Escallonia rubra TaxID=112253 RepID=A0AA88R7R6_9ASTE|nr:hypothetical protein RJ640_016626 [Escallonia rubra]
MPLCLLPILASARALNPSAKGRIRQTKAEMENRAREKDKSKLKCYNCKKPGYLARECMEPKKHEQWVARYGRVYKNTEERNKRFKIFEENVKHIKSFSRADDKPYKLNEFADLTNEEFTSSRNRLQSHVCTSEGTSFKYENATLVPPTMDWTKKGTVTPVKDQGLNNCKI